MDRAGSILRFLNRIEPNQPGPGDRLMLFSLNGDEYHLHADVNRQGDRYGWMWEWWIDNEAGYVDGGFAPANSEDEIRELAAAIEAVAARIESGGRGASSGPDSA